MRKIFGQKNRKNWIERGLTNNNHYLHLLNKWRIIRKKDSQPIDFQQSDFQISAIILLQIHVNTMNGCSPAIEFVVLLLLLFVSWFRWIYRYPINASEHCRSYCITIQLSTVNRTIKIASKCSWSKTNLNIANLTFCLHCYLLLYLFRFVYLHSTTLYHEMFEI